MPSTSRPRRLSPMLRAMTCAGLLLAGSCGGAPTSPTPQGPGSEADGPPLSRLDVDAGLLTSGAESHGTATLAWAVPDGGTLVTLATNDPAATVPSSIRIPAGARSGTFSIVTRAVAARASVTITGSAGGQVRSTVLELEPTHALSQLALVPADLRGGDATHGVVTLNAAAPAGGIVVALSSSDEAADLPAAVIIPAGGFSGTFTLTTTEVSADREITVAASAGGETRTVVLRVRALAGAPFHLDLARTILGAGLTTVATVRLDAPAPLGGLWVNLATSDSAVWLPSGLFIPRGASSGGIQVTTQSVNAERHVIVTGTAAGQSRSAMLHVVPLFLTFSSSGAGDHVGRGQSRRFEAPIDRFLGQMIDGNRTLELRMAAADGTSWALDLSAPPGQSLLPGKYVNATALSHTTPRVDFSGDGRGCGQTGIGEFEVLQAVYLPPESSIPFTSGRVEVFHARFTQQCLPTAPPLTGEVWLGPPLPLVPGR